MNMKIIIASILIILTFSCSEKNTEREGNNMNAGKDIPTPKSEYSTTNPKEDLAPQTCYYGCKARK